VWLTDAQQRIVAGHTKRNELASLLPWNWKAAKAIDAPGSDAKFGVDPLSCIILTQDHKSRDRHHVGGPKR
jgi:hypothetical protein